MVYSRKLCVYMIWSPSTPKVYIGSTGWFNQRACSHKQRPDCTSQQITCLPDWQIFVLEDNIKSKEERRKLEQLHIEGWGDLAVNERRAFVGDAQRRLESNARTRLWLSQNSERRRQWARQYRRRNRAKLNCQARAYYHRRRGN